MASTSANGDLPGFFDALVRSETRLYNALAERLQAEHGIGTAQFELLRHLRDHPDSRVAELAANFAAGIGAISKGIDRFEARGWARRHPNPADGRSSLINLTAAGAALVTAAEQTFNEHLAELVSPNVPADQLEAARVALLSLQRALEDAHLGLPAG